MKFEYKKDGKDHTVSFQLAESCGPRKFSFVVHSEGDSKHAAIAAAKAALSTMRKDLDSAETELGNL